MFDFWEFYQELSKCKIGRPIYLWSEFPSGKFQFKEITFNLLKENIKNKDFNNLQLTLSIIYKDGIDKDYTDILLNLIDEKWHFSKENIISLLEIIKDPKSVDKLYEVALNIPEIDEMCGTAKKCMWALSAIGTPEAIEKLRLLEKHENEIISENATFQLKTVLKLNE